MKSTKPMKRIGVVIILATLSTGVLTHKRTPALAGPPRLATAAVSDSQRASQAVVAFLHWYKAHSMVASRIQLVNQQPGKRYSVNLKNGERYLAYLQTSHGLTNAYLDGWRTFFRERDTGFRLNPQYEGPPIGFDYDLVLLNQDVDAQLAALPSLKINNVTILKNEATVALTLFDAYEFRLLRQNNRWVINEIMNRSQE